MKSVEEIKRQLQDLYPGSMISVSHRYVDDDSDVNVEITANISDVELKFSHMPLLAKIFETERLDFGAEDGYNASTWTYIDGHMYVRASYLRQ
jgi:hypothetical protein